MEVSIEDEQIMKVAIEHQQMVTTLAKDGSAILASMTSAGVHCLHMAVGVAGEAGELLEATGIPSNRKHVIEELGDYEFYMEGLRQGYHIDRPEVIELITQQHKDVNIKNVSYIKVVTRSLAIDSSNILDLVKKVVIYNKDIELTKMRNFMAEVEYVLDAIRQHYNVSRDEVLSYNINKLVKGDGKMKPRYEGGNYSDEAAQQRADKA